MNLSKKITLIISCFSLISVKSAEYVRPVVAATAATAAGYYGYTWLRTPDTSMPTFDELGVITLLPVEKPADNATRIYTSHDASKVFKNKNVDLYMDIGGTLYRAQSGIPEEIAQHKQVCLYSGGCGACAKFPAHAATRLLKAGSMHGACVTFNYVTDHTRARYNFCQEQDYACLDVVYKALLAKHPDAQVVLYSSSKGATNALRFLAYKAEHAEDISNVKAAVFDSAPLSVKRALSHYPLSHTLAHCVFPNYNPHHKTILDAHAIPKIPLFFGRIPTDTIADASDIGKMASHVKQLGNENVWVYTANQPVVHGRITTLPEHRLAVNAFYKHCRLTHNLTPETEAQAAALLQEAKIAVGS